MTTLLIAEHDNAGLKVSTRNTLTAAAKLGSEVDILIAGHNCQAAAQAAAGLAGVRKVLVADAATWPTVLPKTSPTSPCRQ